MVRLAVAILIVATTLAHAALGQTPQQPGACLTKGGTATGTLAIERSLHPNGTPIDAFILRLPTSTCAVVFVFGERSGDQRRSGIARIQLGPADADQRDQIRKLVGRVISVRLDELMAPTSASHVGDVVSTEFSAVVEAARVPPPSLSGPTTPSQQSSGALEKSPVAPPVSPSSPPSVSTGDSDMTAVGIVVLVIVLLAGMGIGLALLGRAMSQLKPVEVPRQPTVARGASNAPEGNAISSMKVQLRTRLAYVVGIGVVLTGLLVYFLSGDPAYVSECRALIKKKLSFSPAIDISYNRVGSAELEGRNHNTVGYSTDFVVILTYDNFGKSERLELTCFANSNKSFAFLREKNWLGGRGSAFTRPDGSMTQIMPDLK